MDAEKVRMIQGFIGKLGIQFRIPVYQRNYDWSEENCDRLLSDVKKIADGSIRKHFLGAVVCMRDGGGNFTIEPYVIIDG